MTAFSELGILPEIAKAIEELDWLLPTDVQAEAIPLILGGGDVLMAAETGSGKTGAFCLPIIQIVCETLRDRKTGKGSQRCPPTVGGATDKVVLNPYDRGDKFAISPDGLLCQCREQKAWHGARANLGVAGGKSYYETIVTDEGLCRVGWSIDRATHELGKDKFGFGFGGTGKKSNASQFDDYGESFGKDDVIGCYIDLDEGCISYSKNGNFLGDAFYIPQHLLGTPFYPAVVLKNAEMKFNFGDSPFKYPPGGYEGVSKASNLVPYSGSAPAVAHGGPKKGSGRKTPMAIIIEPARELAQQTHDNITLFKKHLSSPGVSELLLMGGDSAKSQMQQLSEGVDIVCGTPGRIDDLVSSGKLDLSGIHFFVLDEADGLLSMGNLELIMRVYNKIPKVSPDGKRLQMIVCSATLHNVEVKKLADKLMHFPTWVDLKGQDCVPETVHHVICYVDPKTDTSWHGLTSVIQTDGVHAKDNTRPGSGSPEMLSEAVKLLKVKYLVKAIDAHKMDQAIIFCRTKLDCDNAENYLISLGGGSKAMVNEYACACLHSDRRPQERKANLQAFKEGEVRFLICTDVAARGIDITGIPYVVNVTLPDDKQNYVHRIGRVGRAEKMGLAISLVASNKEKVWYHKCPSRGKGCYNTRLVEQGGCTIWYNEMEYKNDVETHLGVSIPEVTSSFEVPINEYDGKITYGEKKTSKPTIAETHVELLSASVDQLASLEKKAQSNFIKMKTGGKQWFF